jgi:SH3 domain-containing protein
MRIAQALGSMPHLRRQIVPTVRSRVVRGRLQWNLNTGVEQPAQGVSSVNVKTTLADQTPLASSLTLWVIRALIAGLVIVALIPNLILGVIFCAGYLLAELRGRWRGMRIARAIGSMPHLRRQLVPTVRSRPRRRRLQRNFNTAVEKPTQGVSRVVLKRGLTDQTTPLSSLTLSLIRALVAGLILIALIPNLMLGAIFWLGAVDIPWSRSPTITANDKTVAPPSAVPTPVLSSPPSLEASAGGDITLPIALDGTDGVPARSVIAVKGLPQGSKFSSGHPYGDTEWNLKTDEIGDLQLILPSEASGEAKLLIQLVTPEGAVIADTATVLKLTADAAAGASNIKTEPGSAQVWHQPIQEPERTGVDKRLANPDAARVAPEDPVPLPTRRPVQTAIVDDAGATWIEPLADVNLRQRPTRSAPAVGVVEKGVKLRVLGRKNRWVRVTNPAKSEMGWIYAANVSTVR